MICTVVAHQGKFATVLEGKLLGTSKHIDYSVFHWKAKDVASLKKPITKFAFVNEANDVTELLLTADMKERGQNFKTARREPVTSLTDVELAEISGAVELVRGSQPVKPAEPKPEAPASFITPEAAAVGIPQEPPAVPQEPQEPPQPETQPEEPSKKKRR